jgi:hypothetical protein
MCAASSLARDVERQPVAGDAPETDGLESRDEWAGANGKAPPVVLAIRAMLAGRPRIDTVAVVDALLERFQDEDVDGVVAQCIASMRACRAETGRTSSTSYVAWQKARPRPHPRPSLSKLRNVLGGGERNWNVCKTVAYGDAAVDPTTRRLRKERATTPADCEEAGRLWLCDRAVRRDRAVQPGGLRVVLPDDRCQG